MNELAITVIGQDRPGIVADVAEALAGSALNLTDSTMTRLRGHFAMTLICTGPDRRGRRRPRWRRSPRTAVAGDGRAVAAGRRTRRPAGEPYVMSVHGADRLGIVAALTRVLAEAGGNITDLTHPAGRDAVRADRRGRPAAGASWTGWPARLAEVGRRPRRRGDPAPAEADVL